MFFCHCTKTGTYWDECPPSSSNLKENDYLSVQADANAQKIAEDNQELEKENLKLRERLITLEDIQTSEK